MMWVVREARTSTELETLLEVVSSDGYEVFSIMDRLDHFVVIAFDPEECE